MGYATLDAALAFPNNLPPPESHIVIADTLQSDGNFLLHHFIGNHLKAECPVILIGTAQIFNHYFLIGRKLGINLQIYKQSGQFTFVDGLTHLNPYAHASPFPPERTPTAPTAVFDGSKRSSDILKSFYATIQELAAGKARPLILLDDANALVLSGIGHQMAYHFIQKLKMLATQHGGTLVTVCHADEQGSEDPEQDSFVKMNLNNADVVLQLQALNSGLARDVHGQLSIIHGPQYVPTSSELLPQSMHYKVLDNNVLFFAKGISQGVL